LLLTKPVSNWQVLMGKYVASMLLIATALLLTFSYPISVSTMGNLDAGEVFSGYLALLLFSSMMIGIGLFTSSIGNNQIVSYLLALFIGIFFQIIFGMLGQSLPGIPGHVLDYLSTSTHFESMTRGVLDTRDILFFAGISFLMLVFSESMLIRKRFA